jgi:hypothetical protein
MTVLRPILDVMDAQHLTLPVRVLGVINFTAYCLRLSPTYDSGLNLNLLSLEICPVLLCLRLDSRPCIISFALPLHKRAPSRGCTRNLMDLL